MAVSVFKTFVSGEILTAADLNSSFTQITGNGEDLGWPATKAKDLDGQELILDSDGDTSFTADTDDEIDVKIGGFDDFKILANIFRALLNSVIETDTINETTSASGVTIDSLLIKDNIVGATGSRAANGFYTVLTLTGGDGGLVIDNTENTGICDAYGLVTAGTTVIGQGVASVSTGATGIFTIIFDNSADATDEQLLVASADSAADICATVFNNAVNTQTIRAFTANTGVAIDNFPLHFARLLFT